MQTPTSDNNSDLQGQSPAAPSQFACSSSDWGVASTDTSHAPDIRAIIATVPDPIHSHLALEFDRTIDAFLQAAGDNRYLGSQYWLPWKSRVSPSAVGDSSLAPETDQDLKREEQPGLIILKYGPPATEKDAASSGYNRVIYLFVVAETPALGVNGTQLRNALTYEAMLQKKFHAKLSMGEKDQLAMIGPCFSGSAVSIKAGLDRADLEVAASEVIVAGQTSTGVATNEINSQRNGARKISYVSFGENSSFELTRFFESLNNSRYDVRRVAVLSEDGTVFGDANTGGKRGGVQIRFPREISLLRNAQVTQGDKASSQSAPVPTPYLDLSLKDSDGDDDTVPHFSTVQTPLSQEAELMALALQLQRNRAQYALIAGSNILDEIFLAQFLHRADPDARLVFYNGGDLLFERDGNNVPYIGSIVLTPYALMNLESIVDPYGDPRSARTFSDSHAERAYNAASYIFSNGPPASGKTADPLLAGYQQRTDDVIQIPLWATAIGTDGYYPLGVLDPCASNTVSILPNFVHGAPQICSSSAASFKPALTSTSPNAAPSRSWFILCALLAALCIGHSTVMLTAQYWSPFTRDLAVRQNDQPRRRSVYINIGTTVLFSMSFVISFPLFVMLFPLFSPERFYLVDVPSVLVAAVTMLSGFAAFASTLSRTGPHSGRESGLAAESATRLYAYFNLVAFTAAVMIPLLWMWICLRKTVSGTTNYVGVFFSYRSLHPMSGVSPVIPVLLLLLSWYLWAVFQTARLRFSTMSRPRLPDQVQTNSAYPFFISDSTLTKCDSPVDCCLIENVTCLLITRETMRRFTRWPTSKLNRILLAIYFSLFILCIFCGRIQSLERFLLHPGSWPTAYEFLIASLFFPLIMVALTGALRMVYIWGALSRGLLEPLERSPLRVAFSRLKEVGWMSMLRQSSLHLRWRDMARSTESIRQLINNPDLAQVMGVRWITLSDTYDDLIEEITELRKLIGVPFPACPRTKPLSIPRGDDDLPEANHIYDLACLYEIEMLYAKFCECLLSYVLIPYWLDRRIGFVEGTGEEREISDSKSNADFNSSDDPMYIQLSEELLAIRYVALIRSVLVNIRYLMLFVSCVFVLAIIAWNSYPFQPHETINWCFTILLAFLSYGFISIFAQMHRNAILSRITATHPNELGRDFYIRIASFGAIPVLTWFAYQFPDIAGRLYSILQPGLQVAK